MTINIKLDGSNLTVVDPCPIIADGSIGTVKFRVDPDADWDGLAITVVFRRVHTLGSEARSVVISNQDAEYYVPHEVLHDGWLYIGAAGVASGGTVKLTTAKMDRPIRVYESEDAAADPPGSITPEVADQILALIGSVSNLDTKDKSSIVAAINEVHGNTNGFVKTVNQIAPNVRGDVLLSAQSIKTQVPPLDYLGSVEGALEALATMPSALPVARASSGDGIAYTATGGDLPTVSVSDNNEQISAVGKGLQIVFIPWVKNQNDAPTLQLNGGEIIPIRIRAPKNQGTYDNAPTATLPVSAGALMRGVPYTMTFCGKYWLVDSQIAQFTQSDANLLTKYAKFWRGLTDGDSVTFPVVNTQDGMGGEIAAATVERTAEEVDAAAGDVAIPTVEKVDEMIRKDITADYAAWSPESGKTVENYAKTLPDGSYRIADDTIGCYEIEVFTVVNGQQWRIIRDYTDEFCYISVYCGSTLAVYIDSEIGDVQVGGRKLLTNDNIPLPTAADAGKVLTASAAGKAEWTAVTNAEEVAY